MNKAVHTCLAKSTQHVNVEIVIKILVLCQAIRLRKEHLQTLVSDITHRI